MADNVTIPAQGTGTTTPAIATDDVAGVHYQKVKLDVGADGASNPVSGTLPVSGTVTATGPLTDAQLRATAVPVSGTVTASGPLTDAQLRATAVPVSGTVTASGPLTDAQLRATAVPVSGALTDAQLRAAAVPVKEMRGSACTPARVATSTTSAILLAANANRINAILYNDATTGVLYVKFGSTATATDFTVKLYPDDSIAVGDYTGRIDGIMSAGSGNVQVSEIT